MNDYVSTGQITNNGGAGTVVVDYNNINVGKTTIYPVGLYLPPEQVVWNPALNFAGYQWFVECERQLDRRHASGQRDHCDLQCPRCDSLHGDQCGGCQSMCAWALRRSRRHTDHYQRRQPDYRVPIIGPPSATTTPH